MATCGKRKRKVLSIEQKLEICRRLRGGAISITALSKELDIGKSTISDIKKSEEKLTAFATKMDSVEGSLKRKTMKMASDSKLDDAMYLWFAQKRSQGVPISRWRLWRTGSGYSITWWSTGYAIKMPTMGRTADRNKCCSPVHVQKLNRNGGSKEKFKSTSIKNNFILLIIKFNNVTSFLIISNLIIRTNWIYVHINPQLVRIIEVLL